ncbi:hypothetical protein Poli38472_006623 [Pythium oligandrum]|uniref:Fe2OG dioxygenase domain-containing protein n=1 Tax=Pythium oligandrum TaxID=41045 RepID=A0A8K1C561_PYTOL|nr:hypothetical protein Poli38472_006623 [Pythium oligandrum]|eukprot:TMW56613.1 hypothetical protein Poli38472_006623 [Pythium oligandrum]
MKTIMRRALRVSRASAMTMRPANALHSLYGIGSRAASTQGVMHAAKVERHAVPLVDIAPLLLSSTTPSAEQKQTILEEMKKACVETGFFTIPTKGVLADELIATVYKRSDEFCALPASVKQKYHVQKAPNARGWTPLFEEPSYQPGVISHLEGFDLARELPASYVEPGSSLGPNVWPEELPGFQRDVYHLYEETSKISNLLFESFAEMLGLAPDTFIQHASERAEAFMRLLTYPETDAPVKKSIVGIASHTDFECFTIIHQNSDGLHLLSRQGEWVEAPVYNDRLFVMVGDMLERWTNGVLQATEHRVVNSEKKRQSIVRFNGVDGDTVVAPLAQFVTSSSPAKYEPTTQRLHIQQEIKQGEEHLAAAKAALGEA